MENLIFIAAMEYCMVSHIDSLSHSLGLHPQRSEGLTPIGTSTVPSDAGGEPLVCRSFILVKDIGSSFIHPVILSQWREPLELNEFQKRDILEFHAILRNCLLIIGGSFLRAYNRRRVPGISALSSFAEEHKTTTGDAVSEGSVVCSWHAMFIGHGGSRLT